MHYANIVHHPGPLHPLPPPLRGRPGRRAGRVLRGCRHAQSGPRRPPFLGGALHQRDPRQRHRLFLGLRPQMLLLPELPHQRPVLWQGDQRRAPGGNLPRPAAPGRPQHQPGHAGAVAALDHRRAGPGAGRRAAPAHRLQHRQLRDAGQHPALAGLCGHLAGRPEIRLPCPVGPALVRAPITSRWPKPPSRP